MNRYVDMFEVMQDKDVLDIILKAEGEGPISDEAYELYRQIEEVKIKWAKRLKEEFDVMAKRFVNEMALEVEQVIRQRLEGTKETGNAEGNA